MKLFRGFIIFSLLGTPFVLVGWLGFLYFWGGDPFPLENKLREDPRTPSSLGFAMQKFTGAGSPGGTGASGSASRPVAGLYPVNGSRLPANGQPGALPTLDTVIADYARLPAAEVGPRVIAHLQGIRPEEAEQLPMLLGFLRDRAVPSAESAQALLELLNSSHLERLPQDPSWRATYAGIFSSAFARLNPDGESSASRWQSRVQALDDLAWREILSKVPLAQSGQTPGTQPASMPAPDLNPPLAPQSSAQPHDSTQSPDQLAPAPAGAPPPMPDPQSPPTMSPDGRTF